MLEGLFRRTSPKNKTEDVFHQMEKGPKPISVRFVDPFNIDSETNEALELIKREGKKVDFKESMGTWAFGLGNGCFYSTDYANCTGVVIVGEEKKTGGQLTLMTHQNTEEFNETTKEKFIQDFTSYLRIVKRLTKKGSVDCVRFGGSDGGYGPEPEYEKSINLASDMVERELNYKLRIVAEPNVEGVTDVYFDPKNRILYIVRIPQNHLN